MNDHIALIVTALGFLALLSYLPMTISFTSIKDRVNGHWINAYLKQYNPIVAASNVIIIIVLSITMILTWYASDPALIIYFSLIIGVNITVIVLSQLIQDRWYPAYRRSTSTETQYQYLHRTRILLNTIVALQVIALLALGCVWSTSKTREQLTQTTKLPVQSYAIIDRANHKQLNPSAVTADDLGANFGSLDFDFDLDAPAKFVIKLANGRQETIAPSSRDVIKLKHRTAAKPAAPKLTIIRHRAKPQYSKNYQTAAALSNNINYDEITLTKTTVQKPVKFTNN